jgi:hypothetical protein
MVGLTQPLARVYFGLIWQRFAPSCMPGAFAFLLPASTVQAKWKDKAQGSIGQSGGFRMVGIRGILNTGVKVFTDIA